MAAARVLVAVAAIALATTIAVTNSGYFRIVGGERLDDPIERALVFSSYLIILGGAVVIWRPAAFGFRLGKLRAAWPLVLWALAGSMTVTFVALRIFGATPYSNASWFVEVVLVPLSEELVFRGVLLTALIAVVLRLGYARKAEHVAVGINALAFGLAHGANALTLPLGFVVAQVSFAIALGAVCGYVMVRTRSIYPAMLVHAAVNLVVVAT